FTGAQSGDCDQTTAREIQKWLDKRWRVPVGRFALRSLTVAGVAAYRRLRTDAAGAWGEIVRSVDAAGGTVEGDYGDCLRPLRHTAKKGTSGYSIHYCGRAVDINQPLGDPVPPGGGHRRYYVSQEPIGELRYWRVRCWTTKQDGSQGT